MLSSENKMFPWLIVSAAGHMLAGVLLITSMPDDQQTVKNYRVSMSPGGYSLFTGSGGRPESRAGNPNKEAGKKSSENIQRGGQEDAAAAVSYAEMVAALLNENKAYPHAARRMKIEGTAVIRLRIERSGRLLSADLTESSGSPLLDDAVLSMVKRTGKFPPFPESVYSESEVFSVPVRFSLKKD